MRLLQGVGTWFVRQPRQKPGAKVTDVTRGNSYFRGNVEAVLKPYQNGNIDWDEGREGYLHPSAHIHKTAKKTSGRASLLSIPAEERIGSLIAAGGTIWATYAATVDFAGLWRMQIMPPGPVEVCVLGILMWLHAKWRRSLRVD